ncbi:hypothetical protein ACLB2K_028764 [Fragaria x ananassa]
MLKEVASNGTKDAGIVILAGAGAAVATAAVVGSGAGTSDVNDGGGGSGLGYLLTSMAVPMQGVYHVPVGFRFKPTEEELLCYYLRRKIKGLRFPQGVVHHCNVFGTKEPWDIWEAYRDPSDPETKDLYFFTDKPKMVFSCSTIRRVDTGKWRGKKTRTKVHASGSDRVIRWKRRFVYKNCDSVQHDCWVINELELHESLLHSKDKQNTYALCILTKMDKKGLTSY